MRTGRLLQWNLGLPDIFKMERERMRSIIEDTRYPHEQMQQHSHWPIERTFPHSSVSQLGSSKPLQKPPRILYPSNSNISASERPC